MELKSHPIQSCEWLLLQSLTDQPDNTLRVVVLEARAGSHVDAVALAQSEQLADLESILKDARRIEHSSGCRIFEFFWSNYVAYSVRNESFASGDPNEVIEGRVFCKYTRSRFLDYVAVGTFAQDDFPGPVVHWGLNCSEHIIDVISTEAPSVREINQ